MLKGVERPSESAETRGSVYDISSNKSRKYLSKKQIKLDFVIGVGKIFLYGYKIPYTKDGIRKVDSAVNRSGSTMQSQTKM